MLIPAMSHSNNRRWVSFNEGFDFREEGTPPEITIIESNEQHTLLEITIPGMWVEDIVGPDGYTYQVIEMPGYATTSDIGLPQLPLLMGVLGMPDDAEVVMNIVETDVVTLPDDYYIWPFQKPLYAGEEWEFEKDEEFYGSDEWYPIDKGYVGEPGIFKYFTVDNVGYTPFEFNPALQQLKVNPYIKMDVVYLNGGTIQTATMESSMAELMRETIWNFDELPYVEDDNTPVYYLILVPYEFRDQTLVFAKWLESQYPYDIWVKTIPSNISYQAVNYIIEDFYKNHISTDYVLFIGDNDRIPTYPIISPKYDPDGYWGNTIPSDFYYSRIEGNDLWPEVAIGRISFDDSADLQDQFNKIMSYYLTEQPPPDPDWRENVLLVAALKTGFFSDFKDMCEDLADNDYKYQTPEFIKCYADDGANDLMVRKAIDGGVSSVCYFGHGWTYEWSDWNGYYPPEGPDWNYYDIVNLNNYGKLPVVFNITCLNGRIIRQIEPESLCESWMDAWDGQQLRGYGAVTTVGFSHVHYHMFCNQQATERLYHYIYDTENGKNKGIGWLVYIAHVKEYYNNINWGWEYHNCHACIILGDPALRIRTKSNTMGNTVSDITKDKYEVITLKHEINITNPVYDTISIFIKTDSEHNIDIDIYDISGRRLNRLYSGKIDYGDNKIIIDNIGLSSGLYLLNIYSNDFNEIKKVVVLK